MSSFFISAGTGNFTNSAFVVPLHEVNVALERSLPDLLQRSALNPDILSESSFRGCRTARLCDPGRIQEFEGIIKVSGKSASHGTFRDAAIYRVTFRRKGHTGASLQMVSSVLNPCHSRERAV